MKATCALFYSCLAVLIPFLGFSLCLNRGQSGRDLLQKRRITATSLRPGREELDLRLTHSSVIHHF